jgi:hypothetical protein
MQQCWRGASTGRVRQVSAWALRSGGVGRRSEKRTPAVRVSRLASGGVRMEKRHGHDRGTRRSERAHGTE